VQHAKIIKEMATQRAKAIKALGPAALTSSGKWVMQPINIIMHCMVFCDVSCIQVGHQVQGRATVAGTVRRFDCTVWPYRIYLGHLHEGQAAGECYVLITTSNVQYRHTNTVYALYICTCRVFIRRRLSPQVTITTMCILSQAPWMASMQSKLLMLISAIDLGVTAKFQPYRNRIKNMQV
jgi:hypothetical protein